MAAKKIIISNRFKYYTRTFWKIFLGMGSILLFSYLPLGGFFGTMPSFEDLENQILI
jgi:hypothetical protein